MHDLYGIYAIPIALLSLSLSLFQISLVFRTLRNLLLFPDARSWVNERRPLAAQENRREMYALHAQNKNRFSEGFRNGLTMILDITNYYAFST